MAAERLDSRARGSDALVAEIADRFALTPPVSWRDLGGSRTTSLRLDCPDRTLVARVHQGGTSIRRLAAVQAARRAVAEGEIPTVRPIPAPDGQYVLTLRSGRLVELELYVRWNARMNTVPRLHKGFGVLARIHDALRIASLPAAARTARNANHTSSASAAAASRRGAERIRKWGDVGLSEFAGQVVAHVEAVATSEKPLQDRQLVQVVHGDFWDNNVLFLDDRLVAVLDFDFMAERPRIDDLALTAYFFFLEPGRHPPGEAERHHLTRFVDAYDAAAAVPLSDAERACLPLAIARQPAWPVGRWVVDLDQADAVQHARSAAAELPVAQAILAELPLWQPALARRAG